MKIALVGYGKMGKAIEHIALANGHEIAFRIGSDNKADIYNVNKENTDVAIEFTGPDTALDNLKILMQQGVNTISGSTGWTDSISEIHVLAKGNGVGFLWASNFSIGVNLFFKLNTYLSKLMEKYPIYKTSVEEIHHTHKLDKPSGTAITIAEQILLQRKDMNDWILDKREDGKLPIFSIREDPAPGTHTVLYHSDIDDLEIKHTAHSRDGFASGAVVAATFIQGKKGVFTMEDVLFAE